MSHAVMRPTFERRDDRGWMVELLNRGPWETVLWGEMKAGAVMGNHYHRRTKIFFFLTRGSARVDTLQVETGEKGRLQLKAGEGVHFPVMQTHAIRFQGESEFLMLKSEPYDAKDPDTISYPVPE